MGYFKILILFTQFSTFNASAGEVTDWFNCTRKSEATQAICDNHTLAFYRIRIENLLLELQPDSAEHLSDQKKRWKKELSQQKRWESEAEKCKGNVPCLEKSLISRVSELQKSGAETLPDFPQQRLATKSIEFQMVQEKIEVRDDAYARNYGGSRSYPLFQGQPSKQVEKLNAWIKKDLLSNFTWPCLDNPSKLSCETSGQHIKVLALNERFVSLSSHVDEFGMDLPDDVLLFDLREGKKREIWESLSKEAQSALRKKLIGVRPNEVDVCEKNVSSKSNINSANVFVDWMDDTFALRAVMNAPWKPEFGEHTYYCTVVVSLTEKQLKEIAGPLPKWLAGGDAQ